MTLENQLIQEAKNNFKKEFSSLISKFGFNMKYNQMVNSFEINVQIEYPVFLSGKIKKQIEKNLPELYDCKSHKIPVNLEYVKLPNLF